MIALTFKMQAQFKNFNINKILNLKGYYKFLF